MCRHTHLTGWQIRICFQPRAQQHSHLPGRFKQREPSAPGSPVCPRGVAPQLLAFTRWSFYNSCQSTHQQPGIFQEGSFHRLVEIYRPNQGSLAGLYLIQKLKHRKNLRGSKMFNSCTEKCISPKKFQVNGEIFIYLQSGLGGNPKSSKTYNMDL